MTYWKERMAKAQDTLTTKKEKEILKQLNKYYLSSMNKVISSFEATFDKILSALEEGREPTPADLYKLDTYWKMQAETQKELKKLGDKQAVLLGKKFEEEFFDIYNSIGVEGSELFSTIDKAMVGQMINTIWTADGKSWSDRIWENTALLQQTLNEELIHCVVTGKKSSELKKKLTERFGVSYTRADVLVKTELAHIQTQAAQQRYKDYGIQEVEVFVDEDERTCPICAKHEGERYPINGVMPVPFHPRCRCTMLPVVE